MGVLLLEENAKSNLKLIALHSNVPLAQKIADHLGMELGKATVSRHSDGEISVHIKESIRGDHVFLLQSTSYPVDAHIMETLIMMDALRRASAKTINVVIPYFGYGRQDRKAQPREPITAKLIANLLQTAGATRVIALDFHAPQLQGFFDIPVDHLMAAFLIADYFEENDFDEANTVIVATDHSGLTRARSLAECLHVPIAIIDKRRSKANIPASMKVVGDVKGKVCIMADDLIDTGNTVASGAEILKENHAKEIYVAVTHAVLSDKAVEKIEKSPIEKVIVTDSIFLPEEKQSEKIIQITVSKLLADAIQCVHEGKSISPLFRHG